MDRRPAAIGVALAAAAVLGVLGADLEARPGPAAAGSAAPAAPAPAAGAVEPGAKGEEPKLAEARRLFHQGNELRRAGDCQGALDLYQQSRALVPSVPNTWNAAVCLDTLGRFDEAFEMYELLLTRFGTELSEQDRAMIRPAVDQLGGKMGSLDVIGNVEQGTLVVDGRSRAKLPLGGPVRLLPGKHVVQVLKEGYSAFETTAEVSVGQTARVVARLQPLVSGGRLRIDARAFEGAEIFIDGALVGVVPWEGGLEAGEHLLFVRKGELGSAPARVAVVKGQLSRPQIAVGALGPEMRIAVEPFTAEILIDHVPVGHGRWQGRLPLGDHRIEAREEGYRPVARAVAVEAGAKLDTDLRLPIDQRHPRWGMGETGHAWLEAFGGVALAPTLASGAESMCGADLCSRDPLAVGALAGLRGGWEFPVRVSIELAGGYLGLRKSVSRGIDQSFYEARTRSTVATHYELEDELRLDGLFAGAGVGYRIAIGDVGELKGSLLVGAYFPFARDRITATATSAGRTIPAMVEGSSETVGGADLFVMPELELGLRFGGFGIGAGLSVMLLALEGPALETGDLRVVGDGCSGAPTAIDCAPGEAVVAAERAYGTMLVWVPSLSAGYLF